MILQKYISQQQQNYQIQNHPFPQKLPYILSHLYQQMNLGRHQLLQWVNTLIQAQYPSIQSLCDGIAYCQIFEAIHPGSINITRINLITKLPLDCLKNIKILESALKNMKITMTVSIDKLANGRFQDNIIFIQWLYAHAQKYGKQNIENYSAYQRRLQILEKQGKRWDQVNIHLLPNQVYKYHQQNDQQQQYQQHQQQRTQPINNKYIYNNNQQQQYYIQRGSIMHKKTQQIENNEQNLQLDQRIEQINNYICSLQAQLKEKMQLNWRVMHMIGRSIDQRNTLYGLLEQIQKITLASGESPVQKEILRILYQRPEDFRNFMK